MYKCRLDRSDYHEQWSKVPFKSDITCKKKVIASTNVATPSLVARRISNKQQNLSPWFKIARIMMYSWFQISDGIATKKKRVEFQV